MRFQVSAIESEGWIGPDLLSVGDIETSFY